MLVGSGSYIGISSEGNGEFAWEEHYNSAYLVGPSGPPYARVDKIFLTPFGETMPYISSWPWLEERMLAFGAGGMSFDLDTGTSIVRPELPGEAPVRIAVPICFEDTMATVVRRMVWEDGERAANLLLNISNDGWFGSDDAGRRMHTLCARWRAIENDIWVVRVANTGESVVIDPSGAVTDRVTPEPRVPGTLLARVGVTRGGSTPYAVLGELPGQACGVAMMMALMVEWWCRRRRRAGRVPDETPAQGGAP
jgi:apolipoprotein N-acyltransferase